MNTLRSRFGLIVIGAPLTASVAGHLLTIRGDMLLGDIVRAFGAVILVACLGVFCSLRYAVVPDGVAISYRPAPEIGLVVVVFGVLVSVVNIVGLIGVHAGVLSPARSPGIAALAHSTLGIAATPLDPYRSLFFIGYLLSLAGFALLIGRKIYARPLTMPSGHDIRKLPNFGIQPPAFGRG